MRGQQSGKKKGYKFGSFTKSIYNTATRKVSKQSTKKEQSQTQSTDKKDGYKFGDLSKSVYNKITTPSTTKPSTAHDKSSNKQPQSYQFGDYTKKAVKTVYGASKNTYDSVAGPNIIVAITNPIKQDFLHKQSLLTWTYRKQWAVLDGFSLYTFKQQNKYINPIQQIDLRTYDGVKKTLSEFERSSDTFAIGSSSEFEIFSTTESHRFIARSVFEMNAWMKCIWSVIGQSKQYKETHMHVHSDVVKSSAQNQYGNDMEIIAFYIIEMEYNEHGSNSDPMVILRNQNFIISAIIWSYMHQPSELFDQRVVHSMDKGQKEMASYYWKELKAVRAAKQRTKNATKPIKSGFVNSLYGPGIGAVLGAYCGASLASGGVTAPAKMVCLLPLGVIAGTAVGTTYMPKLFIDGYKEEQLQMRYQKHDF